MSAHGMTVSLARKILSEPLRFGDVEQVEAKQILDLVEELKLLGVDEIPCLRCNGTGFERCLGCTLLRFPNCEACAKKAVSCDRCSGEGMVPIENSSELRATGLQSLLAEARSSSADSSAARGAAAGGGSSC
jgi:hypothetical protein